MFIASFGIRLFGRGRRRRWRLVAALGLALPLTLLTAPAQASSGNQIDVYQPSNLGWDSSVGAYKFQVYWTWKPICGSDKHYCTADDTTLFDATSRKLSDPDIVTMAFDKRMQIKKVRLEGHYGCDRGSTVSKRLVGPDTSWDNASSELQDRSIPDTSDCYSNLKPYGVCAWADGRRVCRNWWDNNSMTYGTYTVWAKPVSGCNRRMRVRAFYAHSWSSTTIQVSGQYPLGVGITAVDGTSSWVVSQRSDWDFDDDLVTTVCRR